MATLPSPTQVSGKHNAIFEAYYKQMDPKGTGVIEAMDAAKFLKKSGLSDVVLSRIWDLSDPKGRGFLDKPGFFVALKLVSLAQAGSDINMRNILNESANPPKVGEIPKIMPQTIQSVSPATGDWSMKPVDKLKYEQLFDSLQPVNGLIAGNKVKGVLMDSKLPLETLGKIWDLADQDKDGNLDKHEFTVAMHLVYQALDKRAVPTLLPVELQKPKKAASEVVVDDGFSDGGFVANFPKDIAPPPVPPLPAVMTVPSQPRIPPVAATSGEPILPLTSAAAVMTTAPNSNDWVVTPADRVRYEVMFRDSDKDKDGLVSGLEVKNVFLQSGVPQNCLAHIWALCDSNQSGKLTIEQFALAMWLVEQKKIGIEPPETLAPNMIPPSLRGSIGSEIHAIQQEQKPTYSNPELEMISKEIEELAKERRLLETDIAQKEADIRIKSGEVRSLQSELDTLAATLKQLENQKGEAQKRLDDLKTQKIEVNDTLKSVNVQIEETLLQVNRIREQCQKQEATINEQEEELNCKRSELQKLKDEEIALEKEYDSNRRELDSLTKQLQDTQLQISQVKAMVTQLLETQRQMNDALLLCKAAIEANDSVLVSDYSLKIEPDFAEAKHALTKEIQISKSDPFKDDAFGGNGAFSSDTNKVTNGFGADPFTNVNGRKESLGFADSFSNVSVPGFDDAFDSSGFGSNQMKDPFSASSADPFGEKMSKAVTPEPGKDDFGSDPFAILHAPTSADQILSPSMGQKSGPPPRPESPSPALPPKKSKQPPPRPAPPRPLQGPIKPADSFGSSSGFGDFADFDKLPSTMPPTIPIPPVPKSQNLQSTTHTSSQSITKDIANQKSVAFTDFSEDPFKDYRYEDPFSIKDPFADDDDGERSSEDVFSDESNVSQKLDIKNKEIPPKITNLTPPPPPAIAPRLAPQENFAIFDSFDKNAEKQEMDNFFDAFNDNFQSSFDKGNVQMNSDPYFDPFGTTEQPATKLSNKPLDAFNDNFEDEFFKMNISNRSESSDKTNANFAQFDAFEDAFETHSNERNLNNFKSSTTIKNNLTNKVMNDVSTKIPDKFASDYSKGDSFEDDLQKVIQRSLVDQ